MLPCRLGRLACVIGVDGAAWFEMDMVGGSLGNRWWADRDTAASRCVPTGRRAVAQPYENLTVCMCLTQQACCHRDRTAESRVGTECVSTSRSLWIPEHNNKHEKYQQIK